MLIVVRRRHPLLDLFPLAVIALAILALSFGFAMAAAGGAHDADLPSVPGVSLSHPVPGQLR